MIERTEDYRRAKRFISWPLVISNSFYYLMEIEGIEDIGVWTLHPHKDGVMVHADMGQNCRGRKAVESLKAAFKWIWDNTPFKSIYAGIPADNKPACQVASKAGMGYAGNSGTLRLFELKQG